jgi:hypothetical protein
MTTLLTYPVLDEIFEERERQDKKWGEQHWPDGTNAGFTSTADAARAFCDARFRDGTLTWYNILREEFTEACAETQWPKLRKELIQVAAVCVAWIEDGDTRGKTR